MRTSSRLFVLLSGAILLAPALLRSQSVPAERRDEWVAVQAHLDSEDVQDPQLSPDGRQVIFTHPAAQRSSQPLHAGQVFQDCAQCPRMVVIPAGSFIIGSPDSEAGRYKNEGPQRAVTIDTLALSETEVTRGQFAVFADETKRAADGGCYTPPGDGSVDVSTLDPSASWRHPGFEQTSDHPAVCVSWQDAKEYAAWISKKTGQTYRLPTEAEWEYAVRGGTTTPYFWGQSADRDCVHMNGGDRSIVRGLPGWSNAIREAQRKGESGARLVDCDDGSPFTSVVGRYAANPFGLRDMTGNVWEWVEDCWSPSYEALPADGQPFITTSCGDHRLRGGSWDDYPGDLRSATRKRLGANVRRNDVGLRLARVVRSSGSPARG